MSPTEPTTVPTTCPEPGIYHDVPFSEYLRWPLMSQSTLKEGRRSMMRLKAALDGEKTKKITDDMQLGTALHCAFMEPYYLAERVVEWKGKTRWGSEWNQFVADHPGQIILTPGYYQALIGMVKAMRKLPEVAPHKWQDVEVSKVGTLHGIPFKARADILGENIIYDPKATNSVETRALNNTIYRLGYHIQDYCYKLIFGVERFVFVFVESTAPHDTRIVELGPAWMKLAKEEVLRVTQEYQHCLKTKAWPGCGTGTVEVFDDVPAFVTESSADEITIGGESAFG